MLNYNEFKARMIEDMTDELRKSIPDITSEFMTVQKVNGAREGIRFGRKDSNIQPIMYLDETYDNYLQSGDIENMTRMASKHIMEVLNQIDADNNVDTESGTIVFQLVNKDWNKELLERVPHRDFVDLAIIYRLRFEPTGDSFPSAVVDYKMMESMGKTEEDLYREAMENTRNKLGTCVMPLSDMIGIGENNNGLVVVTNKDKFMGASVIAFTDVLDEAAGISGADKVYILPSSIHEVLVVPAYSADKDILNSMVHDINRAEVKRDEWLSDWAYTYDVKTKEIAVA